MDISALLTSAGINTAVCVSLFSLYSVLRKQPSFVVVYFGQRLAQVRSRCQDPFWFERLMPSASWIKKAWETSEEELSAIGGLDAVIFLRSVVFSIRVFSIAGIICLFLVLPLNYFGNDMTHDYIRNEQLIVFSIQNVKDGSTWLWAHCLALYIITFSTCILLYLEYKSITQMRLAYITASMSKPSHFTVLVRAIPWSQEQSYSQAVTKFFTTYYSSSYLSCQMIYQSGTVQKLLRDARRMYKKLKLVPMDQCYRSRLLTCGLCGGTAASFKVLSNESIRAPRRSLFDGSDLREKECGAAFVFFRTRYATLVAAQALQSPNPMSWVTDLAPEPHDVYWSNLYVPHRLLWIRRIAVLVASFLFVIFFLVPVVFTQSLVHLEKLEKKIPAIKGIVKRKYMNQLITGYLPSVIFMIFLYIVPPLMMVFSALEGSISRSGRKLSATTKILHFVIWNVFFVNILTGSAIDHYQDSIKNLGNPKDIANQIAKAIPVTATFFMTYVLTSGWASLSVELVQPSGLFFSLFYRFILRNYEDSTYGTYTFPYHTEVPRVLLFVVLGFTCSILAPLILPFLLVYFFLAYLVYRNQIINVYVTKYQTGGQYWPIVHNTTIFSLVLTQVIAMGTFGIKDSPISSGSMVPLIICTLLFHAFSRQRFLPVFSKMPANIVIEMDQKDEQCQRMEDIYEQLRSAYCQITSEPLTLGKPVGPRGHEAEVNENEYGEVNQFQYREDNRYQDLEEDIVPGHKPIPLPSSWVGSTHLKIEDDANMKQSH